MAKMYPDTPLITHSNGEVTVFNAFKQSLNDGWSIFHSYRWDRNIGLRESDFVLIHQWYGIIVVEVKGGRVECRERGNWTTTDRYGYCHQIRDPYLQVGQGQCKIFYELKNYLSQYSLDFVKTFRCVIFPDMSENDLTLDDNTRGITLLKEDLSSDNLGQSLVNVSRKVCEIDFKRMFDDSGFCNYAGMSEEQHKYTLQYFNNAFTTYYNPSEIYFKTMSRIEKLTAEQSEIMNCIHLNKKMCLIGEAGSGKTVLAKYKAKLNLSQNIRTLIFCKTNELKKDYCKEFSSEDKIKVITVQYFLNNIKSFNTGYESIIIDEAQDLTKLEFDEIKKITDNIYIFMDNKQILIQNNVEEEFEYFSEFPKFTLNKNIRNSEPIKNVLKRIYGGQVEEVKTDAKEVKLIFLNPRTRDTLIQFFDELYQSKMTEIRNYTQETPKFITISDVKQSSLVCDYNTYDTLCRVIIEHIKKGERWINCPPSCTGHYFDTVRRLKGTEHDCVIVYDEQGVVKSRALNPDNNSKSAIYTKNMLYTAISRAKYDLTIILSFKSEEECELVAQHLGLNYQIM